MIDITSPQNAHVKQLVRLRKRNERDDSGQTIIDGAREIGCALDAGVKPTTLYGCEALITKANLPIYQRALDTSRESFSMSEVAFRKAAYGDRIEGMIAVVPIPDVCLSNLSVDELPLIIVIEGLEKPGNLGAVMRSADAAGVTAVVACEPKTDLFNPNAIRSSIGTVFSVPVAQSENGEAIEWLKKHDIRIFAATPHADAIHTATDFTGPTALILGSEHSGLTDSWLAAADHTVRIPMRGKADSLNLAMSATLLAFEAARQREK